MPRLLLLAALLLATALSLLATGGADAATSVARPAAASERNLAGPRASGRDQGLKPPAEQRTERRAAQLEDDDDNLACKPDVMAGDAFATLPARAFAATTARRACRLSLARAATFRARQRLDDSFPTGPPSIQR